MIAGMKSSERHEAEVGRVALGGRRCESMYSRYAIATESDLIDEFKRQAGFVGVG